MFIDAADMIYGSILHAHMSTYITLYIDHPVSTQYTTSSGEANNFFIGRGVGKSPGLFHGTRVKKGVMTGRSECKQGS